jgi:diaminohydroxyphosphoribosylaminopyrimidine deaminase/5-amino-6-(5-phosphoribosylamino)uracil reductase
LRVVFDVKRRLPVQSKLASDGGPTLVISDADGSGRVDIAEALQRLAALECNEVLVEAGPTLAGSFVASGLVDEIVLYVAPSLLGDSARAAFALPQPLNSLATAPRFSYHDVRRVGPDLRLTLRPLES